MARFGINEVEDVSIRCKKSKINYVLEILKADLAEINVDDLDTEEELEEVWSKLFVCVKALEGKGFRWFI